MTMLGRRRIPTITMRLYARLIVGLTSGITKIFTPNQKYTVIRTMSRYEGSNHAELYRKYRRNTPEVVVQNILNWMQKPEIDRLATEVKPDQKFNTAVDVGCGSGQNTLPFANHFRRVCGFDSSLAQITQARGLPELPNHVTFDVAPAEQLPLGDNSVQLVTGSLSFHFFDLDRFYAEVDRVLVPGGVVAAVGHNALMTVVHEFKGEELNRLMAEFFKQTMTRGRHERSVLTENCYQDLRLPYVEQQRLTNVTVEVASTLDGVIGALSARGSFQALNKEDPVMIKEAVDHFLNQFRFILDLDASTPVDKIPLVIRYNYFVVMSRKPALHE